MVQKFHFMGEKGTLLDVQYYQGSQSIPLHMHEFSELVVVHHGSCIYQYQGNEKLLVAGDVFFIPPYYVHGYRCDANMEFYNCQFYANKLGEQWENILRDTVMGDNLYEITSDNPFGWGYDLLDVSLINPESKIQKQNYIPYLREHKVIHLSNEEKSETERLLESIRNEQEKKESGYENLKQAYLTIMLTNIKRIMEKQSKALKIGNGHEKSVISEALNYIDMNYAENISFTTIAENYYLTPNHFRQLFKKVTGMSPVDYLNRIRVVKSLQYIQHDKLPISEAAAKVGIYDANYFSRMFKKIMGYSPRFFKNIDSK